MKSRIIDHAKLTSKKHLNLFSLECRQKDGSIGVWNIASRKETPKAISKDFSPDAVVLAVTHRKTMKLVLIKQYRPSVDGTMIEFPAGKIDPGESIEDAAKRELFEETGLNLSEISDISPPLYSSSGMTDESIVLVSGYCEGNISTEHNEVSEEIEVVLLDFKEANSVINNTYFKEPVHFDIRTFLIMYMSVIYME